jgi:hypothetical protein
MDRADVQQEAALETAAPPTIEHHQEQQRIQAPSYISPRDPRLRQLSSPAVTQPYITPAQPLHPGSAADASDSGSPVSVESAQRQLEGSGSQVPRPQIAGSEEQQGAEERSQCSHCGSPRSSAKWRRHPITGAWLCDACGQYARRYDGRLPSAAVLQRREQQRQVVAASKERHVPPSQRRCRQCGTNTPGAQWNRHPATKEEWLCRPCYYKAEWQLKRKRQHKAAATASGSDGGEESWQEGEEAQPPSQAAASPQQQAAPVQPSMPGLPVQQRVPAIGIMYSSAEQQQQQQPQGVNPDATWETAPEQPALLPAHMPPAQASTGLLVLEAAQQAAAAAAGLTEGLAGSFAALLPMPAEQVRVLGWQGHSCWQHAE